MTETTDDFIPDYYALLGLDRDAETEALRDKAEQLSASYAELAGFGGAKADEARARYRLCADALDAFESDDARAAYDEKLEAQSRPRIEAAAAENANAIDWFEETLKHYGAGDLGAARMASDRMRQQYRDNPTAFALSAEILLAIGNDDDVKQARRFMDEAVVLDVNGEAAYNVHRVRANVFAALGDLDRAVREAEVAHEAAAPDRRHLIDFNLGAFSARRNTPDGLLKACAYYLTALAELESVKDETDAGEFERQRVLYDRAFVSAADSYSGMPSACGMMNGSFAGDALDAARSVMGLLDGARADIPEPSYARIADYYGECMNRAKATVAAIEQRSREAETLKARLDALRQEKADLERTKSAQSSTWQGAPPMPIWRTAIAAALIIAGPAYVAPGTAPMPTDLASIIWGLYLILLVPMAVYAAIGIKRRVVWKSADDKAAGADAQIKEAEGRMSDINAELGRFAGAFAPKPSAGAGAKPLPRFSEAAPDAGAVVEAR